MKQMFHLPHAEWYVPDARPLEAALARTTHLGIGAHQDDLEIMAIPGILDCYRDPQQWFAGITVTNGSGTPRTGAYAGYTDDEMVHVRNREQKYAAQLGEYGAQAMLGYPSTAVKDRADDRPTDDIAATLAACRPHTVYTHNLADKHDTHVGVALKVIDAIRRQPGAARPRRLLGCEVWRDLDWLPEADKVALRCDAREGLQAALVGVFDSQTTGGKRYDLAALARRRAHATYHASHESDAAQALTFAMDLTPLITDRTLEPLDFVQGNIRRLGEDVAARFARLGAAP